MKKTDLETFREELLATGGYKTPDDRRAPVRRKPGPLVTMRFSFAVSRVFPFCAVCEALGLLKTERWAKFCFSTVTMPESLGMNVMVEGWGDRAAYKGPVMYLCNHMSTLETILLPPILLTYGPFNVVAKNSLAHLPFLEKAAVHMGIVGIGRKNPKADLMRLFDVGVKRISEGKALFVDRRQARREGGDSHRADRDRLPVHAHEGEGTAFESVQGLRNGGYFERHTSGGRACDTVRKIP